MSKKNTSKSLHDTQATDTYDVGYRKPPKRHQFKPGHSGNPKGRPKGAKSEDTVVREVINRKVALRLGGKTRKVSLLEAVWMRIAEDAIKGKDKAIVLLTNRARSLEENGSDASSTLSPDDEQVLASYHRQVEADIRAKDKAK